MKKTLMSLVMLAVATGALSAQPASGDIDYILPWRVNIAYDLSIPGDFWSMDHSVEMFKGGSGVEVGFAYFQDLGANFYFEPGLSMAYSRMAFSNLTVADDGGMPLDLDGCKVTQWLGRVPLLFGYRLAIGDAGSAVRIFTGPVLQYSFSARLGISDELAQACGIERDLFDSDNTLMTLQKFNCGWGVGAGYEYRHYYVQAMGTFGFTNSLKSDNELSFHQNYFNVTLGYYF